LKIDFKPNHRLDLLIYLAFQVSNISFNSLYPIYAADAPPTGSGLPSDVICVALFIAWIFTILLQLIVFPPLKVRLGNLTTYHGSPLSLAINMALMPFTGYRDLLNGKIMSLCGVGGHFLVVEIFAWWAVCEASYY
jgi:hypothetical protein